MHLGTKRFKKKLKKLPDLDEDELQDRWDVLHRRNAALTMQHIRRFGGMLTKFGQSLSAKKGQLPDAWTEALEPLQNEMPVARFRAVQRTVRRSLGCSLEQVFSDFQELPIASASIAQAHIAHLRKTGQKVCVKVQHPGISELMWTDLTTIENLAWLMKKMHDDSPDITDIFKELKRASRDEVDFRLEATNARAATKALQASGLNVTSVEPLPEYCAAKLLTMHFVEGWKLTEVERLPPGTDRETMGSQLMEAFALLIFQEGLIHGDLHPGNVFVEQVRDGPQGLRPVVLDWGISRRVTPAEQKAMAKWVVACLSLDRFLYAEALRELGFELASDLEYDQLEAFMKGGMFQMRDTIPASAVRQFADQRRSLDETTRNNKKAEKERTEGKGKDQPAFKKIPGVVIFFFRGLAQLHDVCGLLEVTVPVSRIMLKYATPLIGSGGAPVRELAPPEPAPEGLSALEVEVRAKLEELEKDGVLLGAQVAVLRGEGTGREEWLCNVAYGRPDLHTKPISKTTLMPLLDISLSVLLGCLEVALTKPTVTGKSISLDSRIEQLWPDFSRAGKAGITIRQVLEHRGGLQRPFSSKLKYKAFCNEQKLEETVAAAPHDSAGPSGVCRVLGIVVAALLRRATGHRSASDSVSSILEGLEMHEDIVYHGDDEERMARVGHNILQEVPMSYLWEMLEQQQERERRKLKKAPPWLAWRDFAIDQPWCADPLLVNRDELRTGQVCLAGRGLRATAAGLCRFLLADVLQAGLREGKTASHDGKASTLTVESIEEWEELGQCLQVSAGWQHLTFQRLDGQGEVVGRGHLDSSTGSLTFSIPGASAAILLTCADKDARRAGNELLNVVARHLDLEPTWHLDGPGADIPDRVEPAVTSTADEEDMNVSAAIRRLEREVARLTKALETSQQVGKIPAAAAGSEASQQAHPLNGCWQSSETEGLEDVLDALGAPAMARSLAKRLKRSLSIDVKGERVTILQSFSLGGRKLDSNEISFCVGQPFEGSFPMMSTPFRGQARWTELPVGNVALLVEKRFKAAGHDVVLEEVFAATAEGRLMHRTKIVGQGDLEVALDTEDDRQLLYNCLDHRTWRVKRQFRIGSIDVPRFGRFVGSVPVASMVAPCLAKLHYDDLQSTAMFDKEGSSRSRLVRRAAGSPNISSDAGINSSTAAAVVVATPGSGASNQSMASSANAHDDSAAAVTRKPTKVATRTRTAPLGAPMFQALL